MHFEQNFIVPDNKADEEVLVKGKKNKKVKQYGILIYKVLSEESSEHNPLKVKDLCLRIIERFHTYIDISTIQDYINELKSSILEDCTLEGNAYSGYYLLNNSGFITLPPEYVLDDIEINIIVQAIRGTHVVSVGTKKAIIKKLNYLASENLQEFIKKNNHITKDDKTNNLGNLFAEDMIEIINECRPMMIKFKKTKHSKTENKYKEFNLYAIENYQLIGTFKNSNVAFRYSFSGIDDYYVLSDKKFEKKPLRIHSGLFFDEELITTLKDNYPNDFIFPTDEEKRIYEQRVKEAKENWKKETKHLTKEDNKNG